MEIFELAKKLDYDRSLAAASAKAPEALFSLIAFHGELGAIRGKVSDPIIFEMRFLWWREAILELTGGTVKKHPVLQGLNNAIKQGELSENGLLEMVEARFEEFQEIPATFSDFAETRRLFLVPFYKETIKVLGCEDTKDNQTAFLAFDLITCLRAQKFYQFKGITLFKGDIDQNELEHNLSAKPETPFFRDLSSITRWHFKNLKSVKFNPDKISPNETHPGKILYLWVGKWL